jgi:hypothetical protein
LRNDLSSVRLEGLMYTKMYANPNKKALEHSANAATSRAYVYSTV